MSNKDLLKKLRSIELKNPGVEPKWKKILPFDIFNRYKSYKRKVTILLEIVEEIQSNFSGYQKKCLTNSNILSTLYKYEKNEKSKSLIFKLIEHNCDIHRKIERVTQDDICRFKNLLETQLSFIEGRYYFGNKNESGHAIIKKAIETISRIIEKADIDYQSLDYQIELIGADGRLGTTFTEE